ncbi:MAG TPA: MarR family winged helix-turn-helix transcriptional regulator [Candidatus Dormibacteraeota bacterium]|jgi:DNA-binding MarR family transcriptional regulator|nr:MarR family winged helix-turn-helix transcriptional regulator [Candidatus Dormibacteraeota bacterium]
MQGPRESLVYQLEKLGRTLWIRSVRQFTELGIYPGQDQVLLLLWERDGRGQGELIEVLGVEPPTVSKMLRRMIAAGLVRRERAPQGGRAWSVFLTERGRSLRDPVLRIWAEKQRQLQAALTADEAVQLHGLVQRLAAQVEG